MEWPTTQGPPFLFVPSLCLLLLQQTLINHQIPFRTRKAQAWGWEVNGSQFDRIWSRLGKGLWECLDPTEVGRPHTVDGAFPDRDPGLGKRKGIVVCPAASGSCCRDFHTMVNAPFNHEPEEACSLRGCKNTGSSAKGPGLHAQHPHGA